MLDALYNIIKLHKAFAFDFEAVDSKGRPTTNPMIARPTLLSFATGYPIAKAVCLDWNEEAGLFLRKLLLDPELTAVCHFGNYDVMLAHWFGIVDVREIRAKLSDTLLLCWMEQEESDEGLGLKEQVFKHLGYKMTEFKEASASKFFLAAFALRKAQEEIRKAFRAKGLMMARECKEEARQASRGVREAYRLMGKTPKEMVDIAVAEEVAKVKAKYASLWQESEELFELAMEEKTAKIERFDKLHWKLMRQYAADDSRQCWRLYKHQMNWVRGNGLERWLQVELENHRRALMMTADGTYIDVPYLDTLIAKSVPLLEEFSAEVCNLAKIDFEVGSHEQLARVLYKDLGIVPPIGAPRLKGKKFEGENWAYSVKREVLERITHPVVQAVLDWRTVNILFNNFMVGLKEQAENDPLKKSRAHVSFKSNGTVTGRWSSSSE